MSISVDHLPPPILDLWSGSLLSCLNRIVIMLYMADGWSVLAGEK